MTRTVIPLTLAAFLVLALALIAGCGGEATTTTAVPSTETTTGGGPEGADLYAADCSSCHGANGQGNIGPALTELTESDIPEIETKVRDGGGGMPSFADTLSEEQIASVAAFVVGLGE